MHPILGILVVFLIAKALFLGSDFNFYHLYKYKKHYWDWYNNRPKYVPEKNAFRGI